jgi:hypothetical protein
LPTGTIQVMKNFVAMSETNMENKRKLDSAR